MVDLYALEVSSRQIRSRVRQEFEKHRYVSDTKVIDRLLFKGRQEYEETMNQWKQKTHVMRYFNEDPYAPRKPETFLEKFYAGRF
jgi:NADH dehydrogenase (ubiquinone) 1 alpha subcomplex subunit 6